MVGDVEVPDTEAKEFGNDGQGYEAQKEYEMKEQAGPTLRAERKPLDPT